MRHIATNLLADLKKPAIALHLVRWFGGLLMVAALSARADVNSWIKTNSGNWDQSTNWSLSVPPTNSQSVMITNSGFKAVDIDSVTVPASLTVSNLSVTGPTNGLNTLLLNFAGLGRSLKVLNNCVIGTNGAIDNFSSSFEVDGSAGGQLLVDGGAFIQDGGKTVVNGPVLVKNGAFNATNGDITFPISDLRHRFELQTQQGFITICLIRQNLLMIVSRRVR